MSRPKFYQTEPQQVEAIQFTGGEESANAVLAWAEGLGFKGGWHPAFEGLKDVGDAKLKQVKLPEQIRIQGKTHPATVPVNYYLYIIVGKDELRTMAPQQFEEKYKPMQRPFGEGEGLFE